MCIAKVDHIFCLEGILSRISSIDGNTSFYAGYNEFPLNERVNWVNLFWLLKGLSRMLGNSQVRFLGGEEP